jgi:enoyl-CoA hydratase
MYVNLEFHADHAVITLNRPEALNALNFALLHELDKALDEVAASSARGLIVTGAGSKAFCAGADIPELMDRSAGQQRRDTAVAQGIITRLSQLRMPSVALINGFALGGGLEVALACTFRIATRASRMGLPEIKLGLIPGYGGTQRLPRLVGESRALDIILSGRFVDAEEALRIGLVNQLVEGDSPMDEARSFLARFTPYSLNSAALAREAISRGLQGSLEEGLRVEADLISAALQSADGQDGMLSFVEKRKAVVRDQ